MIITLIILVGIIIGLPLIIVGFKKLPSSENIWKIKGIEIPESVGYIFIGGISLYFPLVSAYIITAYLGINPVIIQDKFNQLEGKIASLKQNIDSIESEFEMLQNEIRFTFAPYLDTTFVKMRKNDIAFDFEHKCRIKLNDIQKNINKVNIIFIASTYRDENIWLHVSGKNYTYLGNDFRYIISLDSISDDGRFASIFLAVEKKIINKGG